VRGNGRIVDELEALFAGAGWNVIKCCGAATGTPLFARDPTTPCCAPSRSTVDGEFQTSRQRRRLQPRALLQQDPELQPRSSPT
jgi:pyruvate dehydrogenase E1 component